ncbi:MAG: DegT/DnrJ/EryC1/StrS family aminotransferase [Gammaproteobacteria bacterium]|nr:DegT/DnrJ/EryC1/StrS family aminotransferase [Gammaproteobacteria bacterium]
MSKLALFGGTPIREYLFPSQNTMDQREIDAVIEVMKRGRLSGYRGNWCPEFMGGPSVQQLEKEWQKRFNIKHAISVNSATSGLHVACGAIGLKQGDEVIVTPYSMTCSATAPMIYGATPIFADIEKDYFCLNPDSIEERITPNTKAIIVVSLFGQPYDIRINEIAKKHNLIVIEDAAQAVGSMTWEYETIIASGLQMQTRKDGCTKYAGTLGDIAVYSFNYGKHMTCGEGGMLVTNNDNLALHCQLIRNHAEAIINGMPDLPIFHHCFENKKTGIDIEVSLIKNLIGFNMRMTELQAVIVSEQLKKFDELQAQRLINVCLLNGALSTIPAIEIGKIRPDCTHTYYVLPYQWNSEKADGSHRDRFIEAVKAELTEREGREGEGVPIGCGYIKPLYLMPLFQNNRFHFILNYRKGSCPVCEDLWKDRLFLTLYQAPNSTQEDMQDVAEAFLKVWEYRSELK